MSRFTWFGMALLSMTAASVAAQPGAVPLTVDDEIQRIQPSDPVISPDGQSIVYLRSEVNWEKNRRETRLVMIRVETGESFPFTRGETDGKPRFSPDGRIIAFTRTTESESDREKKKTQIWVIALQGGEAYPLTDLSEGVGDFVFTPDGQSIVFAAPDPSTEDERKGMKDGDDAIFVFEGPNGQGRARWSNIWQVALEDKKPRQVTREAMRVSDIAVSPDGAHVAFVYRRENGRNQENLAEVGMARLDNGAVVRLTENEAPESRVRFHPDGDRLVYLAPDAQSWELREPKVFFLDIETREPRRVSSGFAGRIRNLYFVGQNLYFEAGVRTASGLFRLEENGETVRRYLRNGVASDISVSADGRRAAFVWSTATRPPEVALAELEPGPELDAPPRVLTDLNPGMKEKALARVETIRWKSRDGLEIEGLLYRPPAPAGDGPDPAYPLILEIHGGPAGVFTESFRGDRHIYAGLGYATLAPNVRGSSAYGDALLRGNMNDIGGGDYDDLMTGVERVVAMGIADPDKLGVRGWSYGGILGGWVVTQTERFKAASLGAMVSDWRSEYGQGFNFDVRQWYIGGDPWTNSNGYLERSPLTHVQKVTTPTLLLHGEQDTTDTIEQTMNFFNALWEKGTPTRFIRFPREGHGIREPRHQRVRLVEEIAWMQKHIHGIDWSDPRVEETTTVTAEEAGRRP